MGKEYKEIDVEQEFDATVGNIVEKKSELVLSVTADIEGTEHKFQYALNKGQIGEMFVPGSPLRQWIEKYGKEPSPDQEIKIRFSRKGNPYVVGVYQG